ncbi:EamA family transporter, partial [Halobacteriales archaeon QS_9_67_15]
AARDPEAPRRDARRPAPVADVGLPVAVGEHFVMLAVTTLSASIASPIINTQAVVAVLLEDVLLGEDAFRVRLLAAGFAVAGVTMITVG